MILPENSKYLETWVKIPQQLFSNIKPIYYISIFGRIFNEETCNILPKNTMYNKDKYITISLSTVDGSKEYFQIHRLMMMIFNPIPDYKLYDVNHKDGVKYHNWLWNLEWVTRSENIQHALNNNLFNVGETRDNAKLTNEQVKIICQKISEGKSPTQISNEINLSNYNIPKIVMNIINGHSWKHISKDYDFTNRYKKPLVFTDEQIHFICKYFERYDKNISTREILEHLEIEPKTDKELNLYTTTISSIRNKKYFKNICKNYNY